MHNWINQIRFGREQDRRRFLCRLRWPGVFVCPRCSRKEGYATSRGTMVCKCGREVAPTQGSLLQRTRMPLEKWFKAVELLADGALPPQTTELGRMLQLGSYQTALHLHRLLSAVQRQFNPLDGQPGGAPRGRLVSRGDKQRAPGTGRHRRALGKLVSGGKKLPVWASYEQVQVESRAYKLNILAESGGQRRVQVYAYRIKSSMNQRLSWDIEDHVGERAVVQVGDSHFAEDLRRELDELVARKHRQKRSAVASPLDAKKTQEPLWRQIVVVPQFPRPSRRQRRGEDVLGSLPDLHWVAEVWKRWMEDPAVRNGKPEGAIGQVLSDACQFDVWAERVFLRPDRQGFVDPRAGRRSAK